MQVKSNQGMLANYSTSMYNDIQKVGAVVSIGKVGKISADVIFALNLSVAPDTPIYIGKTNIDHMLSSHPDDYVKYGVYIREIIAAPEYVGQNPKDGSIEYVKEFQVDGEFVKVAVRVSTKGQHFARSIYVLNKQRVLNFIEKGTLKRLTEPT